MFVVGKVLPFFLVMGVGVLLARFRLIDQPGASGLSRYVYWVGFPALLIHSLGHAAPPSAEIAHGLIGYAAGALAPLIVAGLIARAMRWPLGTRAALPMCAGLGNDAFLGLPLIASLLGAKAAGWSAALVAMDWVLVASVCAMALDGASGPKHWGRTLGAGVLNPIVAAAVIGVVLMFVGGAWPTPLEAAVSALAASGSPIGLVALGAVIALPRETAVVSTPWAPIATAIVLKLVMAPAVVAVATWAAGAPHMFVAAAAIIAACPTAVTVFIQARGAGVFIEGAAKVVAVSALLSAFSLTALAAVLAG